MRAPRFALVSFASALVIAIGCRRGGEVEADKALLPPSSAAPPVAAADQLRPGELAEGEERAFGLVVPRDLRVVRRFSESTVAAGSPRAELVSNYVRDRVDAKTVEIGPTRTVFASARVKGEDDGKLLHIEVVQHSSRTELVVKDITRIPIEPGLTEEERWEKAGLSPSGKQLGLQEMQ